MGSQDGRVNVVLLVEADDGEGSYLGDYTRLFSHQPTGCKPCRIVFSDPAVKGGTVTVDVDYVDLNEKGEVIYRLDEDDFDDDDSVGQLKRLGFKLVPGTAPTKSPARKRATRKSR